MILSPDLTWIDGAFRPGVRIGVADGRISSLEPEGETTMRLTGRALLPGVINAHSHAFQRGLRGLGERFPQGQGSFWSWREQMYALVERLDERLVHELSLRAFREMLAAGVTAVGEFHYVHHGDEQRRWDLDDVILRAARDAGIRIVLLNVYYRAGGFDEPLRGGQRRFDSISPEDFWAQHDRLAERLEPRLQHLGAAVHSVRAAPIEEIEAVQRQATRRGLVLHMHVEEQPAEIEQCLRRHGRTPLALLNESLEITPLVTAVHLTHSAEADLDDFLAAGGNACICPLTEANLGDGLPNLPRLLRGPAPLSLGTDSNARICFTEEMRWLEYAHRLFLQSRGVCRDEQGRVAAPLIELATAGGARALGLRAGAIRPGYLADFVTIDLGHPSLAGWTEESLAEAWVLGTGNEAIADVCVGGEWRGGHFRFQI